MGLIPAGCWNSLQPLANLCASGTEPISALIIIVHWLLYCCALYSYFFSQISSAEWQSSTDRVLTSKMNIRLPLFWSTWSRVRGKGLATCAGLAHWQWLQLLYSLSATVPEKDWQLVFLELLNILKKHRPTLRVQVSQPSHPGVVLKSRF